MSRPHPKLDAPAGRSTASDPLSSGYWRRRAEDARLTAHESEGADTEASMLAIARMYDELADRAKARESGRQPDNVQEG